MTIEFKEYAKDTKLNLSSVLKTSPESNLSENQILGIALASSYATKDADLVADIIEKAEGILREAEINAAKSCATIMAMNNIYYRFIHLSSDSEYGKMPAKLRMNVIANPGIEKIDYELYALAISAINGCGLCIDSHVKQLARDLDRNTIQHSIKIAAVINSVATANFIN